MRKRLVMTAALLAAAVAISAPLTASAATTPRQASVATQAADGAPTVDITIANTDTDTYADADSEADSDVDVLRTGNYEYVCQMPNGQSWSMQSGEPLTNCKGSYLQKYLDGRLLKTYSLTYNQNETAPPGIVVSGSCVLAIAGGFALIMFPPTSVAGWITVGSLTAAGIATSCPG